MLGTVAHNLEHEGGNARFQRQVFYDDVPQSVADRFQEYSHEKSLAILLDFYRWLAANKDSVKPEADEPTKRVGVGVYYFENDK